jgi:hypothetical protein
MKVLNGKIIYKCGNFHDFSLPCLITGEYTDFDHFAISTIPSTTSDPENDHSLAESMFGWGKVKWL